jgi:hypothetical protein
MPSVNLWSLEEAALIVEWKTGVVFSNQTGGCACCQREMEGLLIPFNPCDRPVGAPTLREQLAFLINAQYLTEELAGRIDALLEENYETRGVTVDRSRLRDSMEAWIHVDIDDSLSGIFCGFGRCKGVITWPNSD